MLESATRMFPIRLRRICRRRLRRMISRSCSVVTGSMLRYEKAGRGVAQGQLHQRHGVEALALYEHFHGAPGFAQRYGQDDVNRVALYVGEARAPGLRVGLQVGKRSFLA